MKPAWFAAFALSLLCPALSHPQTTPPDPPARSQPPRAKAAAAADPAIAAMSESELRQKLVGRPLFLRGLWLDEALHFDMDGNLVGQSPKGSFTLCGVLIDRIHVTKKSVELVGIRYGVHFEDEAPWKDQATSFDRIQITPRKKHQVIMIDRQLVVIPKKRGEKGFLGLLKKSSSQQDAETSTDADEGTDATTTAPVATGTPDDAAGANSDEAKTTPSPAESAERLRTALNKILAPELDAKMVAAMPDYWQFFYQAQQEHKSLVPTDPNIVRPGPGVETPRLVKNLVPESNEYAQQNQVAGVATYKVILGADGKPLAVAVYRPIGFGLDESAVAAIKKSTFTPAEKDGKPVASMIDLAVQFRIYSKLTSQPAPIDTAKGGALDEDIRKLNLPGPFTAAEEAQAVKQ